MSDLRALQDFSNALRHAQPIRIAPDFFPRIAECLACEEIDAQGASFAARIAVAGKLRGLPFLTLPAIGRLDPDFKDLLLAYLEHEPLLDPSIETLLTKLRRAILMDMMVGVTADAFGLDLIAALAIFCFANEYVFAETDTEVRALAALESDPVPATVALLACYRPLHRFPHLAGAWETPPPGVFARMIAIQVTEPGEEQDIARAIPTVSPIADETSRAVQDMYEANPYPRWKMLRPDLTAERGESYKSILVAGCGSGRHALLWARAYPEARVMAVDLSRASLAYGLRKARAYGIGTVDFHQGDILELPRPGSKFDLISCIGVLHHMAMPRAGLAALASLLGDGGTMELGLYTESGRTEVAAAIALRQHFGIPPTSEGIRAFRQMILGLSDDHPAKAARNGQDFYSMSGCRDYLFHVMEHRLTLAQIDPMLRAAGLRLTRMGTKPEIGALFARSFTDAADLLQWHDFELQNPGCFGSMYEMHVART
jgi:ubiquinone/menaquinone biosynthesis C-methylase UbiE